MTFTTNCPQCGKELEVTYTRGEVMSTQSLTPPESSEIDLEPCGCGYEFSDEDVDILINRGEDLIEEAEAERIIDQIEDERNWP